jgi:Tfp pilus assembly protein FimT
MSTKTDHSYSLVRPVSFRARNRYPGGFLSSDAASTLVRRRLPPGSLGGFTLVEMIISCALLLIITAIAAPYFQLLTASSQVKGAVQTVTTDLQLTKMRSISLSKRCRLLFLDNHSYKLQSYNSEAALWEDMANEIIRDFSSNSNPHYHEGVTITAPVGNEVVFQPWGSTATAAFSVQNTEKQGAITVSPTGKVCSQVTDV